MKAKNLVSINDFCANHNIDVSFISSLKESGLIEITTVRSVEFIDGEQLHLVEKFVRLYYELDINIEGIETINYLLQRINSLQDEIRVLRNTLRIYENIEI
jgi:chaperone modulatory protein CbpM